MEIEAMKTTESKTPAVQAKQDTPFFGKERGRRFFGSHFFQPKLTVGQPNDIYEKEADATADKVVQRLSEPKVIRQKPIFESKADPGEDAVQQKSIFQSEDDPMEEAVQKKPIFESKADSMEEAVQRKGESSATPSVSPSVESTLHSSKGSGSPLPTSTRRQMEGGFGADFSGVRIHDDNSAKQMSKDLHAQAFTHGKDIYFNSGKYDPQSTGGKRLLAHELTHVVQQNKGVAGQPAMNKKESGTEAGREANQAVVQRVPMIQRAGGNDPSQGGGGQAPGSPGQPPGGSGQSQGGTDINSMTQQALDNLGKPDNGYLTKDGDGIKVHFVKFPLKEYAGPFVSINDAGNEYVTGPPFLKPKEKRNTKQGEVWRAAAIPLVTQSLQALITKNNVTGPTYLLKVKAIKGSGVLGTIDEIARQVAVPFWGTDGKQIQYEIEHKIDWQLAGGNHNVDAISNLILLDKESNHDIGQLILGTMRTFYANIYKFYQDKKVTGLAEDLGTANEKYKIFTEDFTSTAQMVKGSLLSISNFGPGKANDPLSENLVSLQKGDIPDGYFVLKTSKSTGVGNLVKYENDNNEFIEIKGKAATHTLDSITLKNVVKDKNRNLDLDNPDKTFKFTREAQDIYRVETAGYSTMLRMRIRQLSPIQWDNIDFSPLTGWDASGTVKTTVPLLDQAHITIALQGTTFSIQAEVTTGNLENKLPHPFQVDHSTLTISVDSNKDFSVGGEIGFAIGSYGKGQISGKAGSNGFGLQGKFQFDPKYFTGYLTVGYEKLEAGEKWSIAGGIKLQKKSIKGLESLDITFSYSDKVLSGTGHALLSLPGVKSIDITASTDESNNFNITGQIELSNIPKLKGAKAKFGLSRTGDDWNASLEGQARPDLNIPCLTIDEVAISYQKGVFDVAASAHFAKGRVQGNFTAGVTNSPVGTDGKKTGGEGGKNMSFYADGKISIEVVDGVGGVIDVKVTPNGDILLDGRVELTDDKPLFTLEPIAKHLPVLDQNFILASCVVVTLSLHVGGAVDLYANLAPLVFDKGSYIGLSNVSLKNFGGAKITSLIMVSSHLDAGIKVSLEVGLDAALLGILHVQPNATGSLDFRALNADVRAMIQAGWSADNGLQLESGELDAEIGSKLIASIGGNIKVFADLLVTTVTLWHHDWTFGQIEKDLPLFGKGKFTLPLPVDKDGNIALTPGVATDSINRFKDSVKPKDMAGNAKNIMDSEGQDQVNKQSEADEVIKNEIIARFTDPDRFVFNKTNDYLTTRYKLVNYLREKAKEEKNIDLSYVEDEIKKCEHEEYVAFTDYIQKENSFSAVAKNQVIEDFIVNHPTIDDAEKESLRSYEGGGQKDQSVQKKEESPVTTADTQIQRSVIDDVASHLLTGHDLLDFVVGVVAGIFEWFGDLISGLVTLIKSAFQGSITAIMLVLGLIIVIVLACVFPEVVVPILVGIGVVVGAISLGRFLYLMVRPGLTPYERGKYLGKAIVEGVLLALTALEAFRTLKTLGQVAKISKGAGLIQQLKWVRMLLKYGDTVKVLQILVDIGDVSKTLQFLQLAGDVKKAAQLLELAGGAKRIDEIIEILKMGGVTAEDIIRLMGRPGMSFDMLKGFLRNADGTPRLPVATLERLLKNAKIGNAEQLKRLLDSPKLTGASHLEGLLGNAKIADGAQLEKLLGNAKIADGAGLERLLASAKVTDGAQLEKLLENAKIAEGVQVERLLGNAKVVDAAQLERLLGQAKLADAAQLERLLGQAKLADAAQLERIMGQAKLVDGVQAERLLANAKLVDGAQLERLLSNGKLADGAQLERLLAHAKVADGAQLERLVGIGSLSDGAQLERLLNVATIADAAHLERLMGMVGNATRLEKMIQSIGDAVDLERFLKAGNPIWEGQVGTAPAEAQKAAAYAAANGGAKQPGYAGNKPYGNNGKLPKDMVLPRKDAAGNPIHYREYDINPTPAPPATRDALRIVIGSDGRTFYTATHYTKFVKF
jgi:hypothetical protein